MSSPPVDPWSGQPEHDSPHGHYPPQGGPPTPPSGGGWPTTPYPAAQAGGWPAAPQSGPPADPYPPQPYGGYPAAPQQPAPTPGGYPGAAPPSGYPGSPQPGGYPGAPQPGGYPDPTQQYPGFASQPFSSPPGMPTGPQPRQSRLPLILTLGLAGLLVLCLGGGGLAYVALSGDDKADPTPTPTAGPTSGPSGTPTETAAPTVEPTPSEEADDDLGQVRLVTPATLGGRSKSTDPELRRIADQMVRDMKSEVSNETGAVSAFYGSAARRNMVMMAGASGPVILPEQELDDAVKGLSSSLAVKKMSVIEPGPLGGVAKCGDGKASGIALGVCVWADHGSVGMIVMYFSSAAKAKSEFASVRGQIEKRD
ncbi:hypothetical protein [Micromonospora sp. NPDC092111]|uniref:hypothetical protein n=1 Tax=Micromonospora sp. NPDC092111 TaxID=3364289 RepID=UPI00381F768D